MVTLDGESFAVEAGENLLSSLLEQGADVRFSCRAGACGSCALFDTQLKKRILSCQTPVHEPLELSSSLPAQQRPFQVIFKELSDDAESVALTLLGASDDAFGDYLLFELPGTGMKPIECMALNPQGEPLCIVIHKKQLSDALWQAMLSNDIDAVTLHVFSGERKGRLLVDLNVSGRNVLYFCDARHQSLIPYWQAVLADDFQGALSIESLTDSSLSEFMGSVTERFTSNSLSLVIQGKIASMADWQRFLRAYRIRPNQIHIIR